MEIFGNIIGADCLLFDIDNTLYIRGEEYFSHGSSREIEEVALILDKGISETRKLISERKGMLEKLLNRPAALTEAVFSLGVTAKQWSEIRCQAWNPKNWLSEDLEVCQVFSQLFENHCIHFGTNSPVSIGEQIVRMIGLKKVVPCSEIFGPENLDCHKPQAEFFSRIASSIGLVPSRIISIGDRDFSDIFPALDAGYAGAILLSEGRDDLLRLPEVFSITTSDNLVMKGE